MDPFVRRLIQRLHEPARPLSRNRHFHTFDTPEGKAALRLSRRLLSLQKDILGCLAEGSATRVVTVPGAADTERRIELRMVRLRGTRVSTVSKDEFELLLELPGVRDAVGSGEPPFAPSGVEGPVHPERSRGAAQAVPARNGRPALRD